VLVTALGGAPTLLLFGSGHDTFPFKPGCEIQILPLYPISLFLPVPGAGAGAGALQIQTVLPPDLAPSLLTLQFLFADPCGPCGFTVSNPLETRTW